LAAGLATALLYEISDNKLGLDPTTSHEPSECTEVLATVINAIAGYALIQKAA